MPRAKDCPNQRSHTVLPVGYAARDEWMERMSKTHEQIRCSGCGRWAIWVPLNSTMAEEQE